MLIEFTISKLELMKSRRRRLTSIGAVGQEARGNVLDVGTHLEVARVALTDVRRFESRDARRNAADQTAVEVVRHG